MKKILLIITIIFLTGCVEVTTIPDNACYRYIDYKGEEHYMDYHENSCYTSSGRMICNNGKKKISVLEFEVIECLKEEE